MAPQRIRGQPQHQLPQQERTFWQGQPDHRQQRTTERQRIREPRIGLHWRQLRQMGRSNEVWHEQEQIGARCHRSVVGHVGGNAIGRSLRRAGPRTRSGTRAESRQSRAQGRQKGGEGRQKGSRCDRPRRTRTRHSRVRARWIAPSGSAEAPAAAARTSQSASGARHAPARPSETPRASVPAPLIRRLPAVPLYYRRYFAGEDLIVIDTRTHRIAAVILDVWR